MIIAMKKINLILFVVGFALIFTACKKEEIVRLEAEIEDYTGQKAFIDGDNFSCFSIGDSSRVLYCLMQLKYSHGV